MTDVKFIYLSAEYGRDLAMRTGSADALQAFKACGTLYYADSGICTLNHLTVDATKLVCCVKLQPHL